MKKEVSLSEFIILENFQRRNGAYFSHLRNNPTTPLLSIASTYCTISKPAIDKMQIKKNDRVAFSFREDATYFAVLPIDSKILGYAVVGHAGSANSLYVSSVGMLKRGLIKGCYALKDPIFAGGIDWYELELIKLKENGKS